MLAIYIVGSGWELERKMKSISSMMDSINGNDYVILSEPPVQKDNVCYSDFNRMYVNEFLIAHADVLIGEEKIDTLLNGELPDDVPRSEFDVARENDVTIYSEHAFGCLVAEAKNQAYNFLMNSVMTPNNKEKE